MALDPATASMLTTRELALALAFEPADSEEMRDLRRSVVARLRALGDDATASLLVQDRTRSHPTP